MGTENKGVKPTDIVEVEVKGKKYKVTKAFKDDMDADRADLTTKVTTLETDRQTLRQRLDAMEKDPLKNKKGDDADINDDDGVTFAGLMDNPDKEIQRGVSRVLKKLGIDPSKQGGVGDIDQKVQLILAQDKWRSAFWREHDYFDEDVHADLIPIAMKKLMPKIKELSPKEGRAKIAEFMADMMGRKIIKGKLEGGTTSKHDVQNGMQLEGADGGDVDNGENSDDTNRNKGKSGSMAEDLRRRKEARQKAAKGK